MVGWRDERRRRFFRSFTNGIYAYDDGNDNQVLLSRNIVNVRRSPDETPADIRDDLRRIRESLRRLNPIDEENDECIVFGEDAKEESAAYKAVTDHPDRLVPNHVLIAQQRVQPGDDPEPSWPLPEPDPNSELGRGVRIAVVDTGVAAQNGAQNVRARNVWVVPNGRVGASGRNRVQEAEAEGDVDPLYDFRTTGGAKKDRRLAWAAGHGTFIASLIRQVAPAADIIPIRGCSEMGYETEDNVAAGVRRAISAGANIINLSWCSYVLSQLNRTRSEADDDSLFHLYWAVQEAIANGIVVVAAAGNSASPDLMYPAAWKDVVAVGALNRDGSRWERSNYGAWVDTWALGVKLRGDYVAGKENPANDPDGKAETWEGKENFATWTGTSFAAPLVAAQIAIVQSAAKCTAPEAKDRLLAMSKPASEDPSGKRIMVDVPDQT